MYILGGYGMLLADIEIAQLKAENSKLKTEKSELECKVGMFRSEAEHWVDQCINLKEEIRTLKNCLEFGYPEHEKIVAQLKAIKGANERLCKINDALEDKVNNQKGVMQNQGVILQERNSQLHQICTLSRR